jgi:hypothetical protein
MEAPPDRSPTRTDGEANAQRTTGTAAVDCPRSTRRRADPCGVLPHGDPVSGKWVRAPGTRPSAG